MLVHKQGDGKRHRQACDFTPNRDFVAGDERLEMPFIPFILSTVTVQSLKRTNWMTLILVILNVRCFTYYRVFTVLCQFGNRFQKVPCLLFSMYRSQSQLPHLRGWLGCFVCHQLNGPSERSPVNMAQLPFGCFNPPLTCRDAVCLCGGV